MVGIKIVDRDPRAPRRRPRLWECFGRINVNPTDIKDGNGAYYAIVKPDCVEEILSEEEKEIFRNEGFNILPPLEYNALKSVVVRHLDKVIAEYSDEEVIRRSQVGSNFNVMITKT